LKLKLIRITTVAISLKILLKDQLAFMNKHFNILAVSSSGKELSEVHLDEGIRVADLEMSREITPLKDLLSLAKMVILFLKEKPEIVHTHTPKAGIIGMLAAFICRVPHRLHTVAGLPVMEAKGRKKSLLLFVEKLTYACATKVYPNSYGLQEYILDEKLCSPIKLKVIGYGSSNGIDTEHFSRVEEIVQVSKGLEDEYGLKEKFVFCFVGRVVKDKGINELMSAFEKLSSEFENISLFIVGKMESELDPISSKSEEILENNKSIIHVGFQSDIRPYLVASDCFVLPTYREGFPNVVLQAASMELPSIVTDINGCNEIIHDSVNGLVVEPKNSDVLYDAMKKFMVDENLKVLLSTNVRDEIVEKYDRKNFHQYLLDEYNEVIENV